ncbi:hypothetical protein K402DRAFT_392722 [Aulographum hederae CBS 113979]|uniref:Zn(2)-C6 fungal-type domain-containing protein n=1 Tax=Aulographum hederae CBS 113979 TaxID=1176131 RepID=A0A6G1H2M6_9PEZI|nr:hypothetical protein K402DRAFT_392722 [Aulographum hederae CBS 113979]
MEQLTPTSFEGGHRSRVEKLKAKQTRARKTLSCDQCHRSKVKCDREQPCSRCTAAGRSHACTYVQAQPKQSASKKRPAPRSSQPSSVTDSTPDSGRLLNAEAKSCSAVQPPLMHYRPGKVKHGGRTHWAVLIREFQEAQSYFMSPDFKAPMKRLKSLKSLFPQRSRWNYPFLDPSVSLVLSNQLLSYLPERHVVEALVENYINTFDKTHRLLHPPSFRKELAKFWEEQSIMGEAWLSQLFVMMALGLYANSSEDDRESVRLVDVYLDAAAAAIHRTRFLVKPSYTSIRTLCMMVLAKLTIARTFGDADDLWSLMGLVVRLSMWLCLHRDPKWFETMPVFDAEIRRRLWNTVVFLDLCLSIVSGLPLLIRSSDYDTAAPLNVNDDDLAPDSNLTSLPVKDINVLTDSTLQIRLSESFPAVSEAVQAFNSLGHDWDHEKVTACDEQIRHLLREAPKIFEISHHGRPSTSKDSSAALQGLLLSIYLRRILLSLHQPFAFGSDGHPEEPVSHYAVLECSLALLSYQRQLYDFPAEVVGSSSCRWFGDICRAEFVIAALFVALGLRKKAFSDEPNPSSQSAMTTASEALRTCADIWKSELVRSIHHMKISICISVMIATLDAITSGSSIREALLQVAEFFIGLVQRRMRETQMSQELPQPTNPSSAVESPLQTLAVPPDSSAAFDFLYPFDTSPPDGLMYGFGFNQAMLEAFPFTADEMFRDIF